MENNKSIRIESSRVLSKEDIKAVLLDYPHIQVHSVKEYVIFVLGITYIELQYTDTEGQSILIVFKLEQKNPNTGFGETAEQIVFDFQYSFTNPHPFGEYYEMKRYEASFFTEERKEEIKSLYLKLRDKLSDNLSHITDNYKVRDISIPTTTELFGEEVKKVTSFYSFLNRFKRDDNESSLRLAKQLSEMVSEKHLSLQPALPFHFHSTKPLHTIYEGELDRIFHEMHQKVLTLPTRGKAINFQKEIAKKSLAETMKVVFGDFIRLSASSKIVHVPKTFKSFRTKKLKPKRMLPSSLA